MKYSAVQVSTIQMCEIPKENMIECDDIEGFLAKCDIYEVFGNADSLGYFVINPCDKYEDRVYLHFINTSETSAIKTIRIIRMFLDNIGKFTNGQELWTYIPRTRPIIRKLATKLGFIQHKQDGYFYYEK